jgi:hypothetical protein
VASVKITDRQRHRPFALIVHHHRLRLLGDDGHMINRRFTIAQQAQPVVMNDQGEGTVTLPIGDFNGELRVMARRFTATF